MLAESLGSHVGVRVHLREDVIVALVSHHVPHFNQMDPSYRCEIALDQVCVARVFGGTGVDVFHSQVCFLVLCCESRSRDVHSTSALLLVFH